MADDGAPVDAEPHQATVLQETSATNDGSPTIRRRRPARRKGMTLPVYEQFNWLIYLLFARKDYDKCLKLCLSQIEKSHGNNSYALYIKGLVLRAQGKITQSLEIMQTVLRLEPSNASIALEVAKNMLGRFLLGRFKGALGVYQQLEPVVQDLHARWRLYIDQSRCLRKLELYADAQRVAEKAVELIPNVTSLCQLGEILEDRGDNHGAIDAYNQAHSISPEDTDVMLKLALCNLYVNNPDRAFELFGNALAYNPKSPDAILGAGSIIQNNADFDVALVKYRVSAVKTPESAELWNNIGMCFFGKQKYVAAIACLKHAAYLAPFEWMIAFNLGLVHLTVKQYASAFHFFTAAASLNSAFAPSFGFLGVTLHKLQDDINAELAFQKALDLDSENPIILINYIIVLLEHDNMEEAAVRWRSFDALLASKPGVMAENPDLKDIVRQVAAILTKQNFATK